MSPMGQVHAGDSDGRKKWVEWLRRACSCIHYRRFNCPTTLPFYLFFEEQLLSMRPVFLITNPSLTTATAVVVKGLAAGHLLSPCWRSSETVFLFKLPTHISPACFFNSRWQLFHCMPASTELLLPNHDHPGGKSMLNLVCTLHGRWCSTRLWGTGICSARLLAWESLSQNPETGPHPDSPLSLCNLPFFLSYSPCIFQ